MYVISRPVSVAVFIGLLVGGSLPSSTNGWSFGPTPRASVRRICRKAFLTGAAAGALIGVAGAAGAAVTVAAVAIDNNNKERSSSSSKKNVYEPAPGSMEGKVVLITGGSSGLGLESAKRLGAAGATVVLTSRTTSKGERAVREVQNYLLQRDVKDPSNVYNLVLDLDDLDTVKAFPAAYRNLNLGALDVLLNNAGVMAIPNLQLTKDGYERTFQSNHLGHFVLTAGLFPFLNRTGATVINVSSAAYTIAAAAKGLELDNLNGENGYGPWTSYGQSKLSNILFTRELQKRADSLGYSWLTAVCLHPGVVQTDLARYIIGEDKLPSKRDEGNDDNDSQSKYLDSLVRNALSLFLKTPAEGASTQIYLASSGGGEGNLERGAYYDDLQAQNLPAFAKDEFKAKRLWEISEALGGIEFDLVTSTVEGKEPSSSSMTTTTPM